MDWINYMVFFLVFHTMNTYLHQAATTHCSPLCEGRRFVYSFTDNTVAMSAMRGLTPSTSMMQQLTERRVEWLLEHHVSEAAERITSKANLWSDMLSRGDEQLVVQQARALGLRVRRVQEPAEWRRMLAAEGEGGERRGGPPCAPALPLTSLERAPLPIHRSGADGAAEGARGLRRRRAP